MMKDDKNSRVLALDSSSQVASVALCQGERLVAESFLDLSATHSETLLLQIDTLLKTAGWQLTDLDLLAVVSGPGSFTGLRIGIATVKSLAQTLAKPVVAVSSLRALAANLPLAAAPVCAFLDARKKEVYWQLFQWQDGQLLALDEAAVEPPQQCLDRLPAGALLVGNGVAVYRSLVLDGEAPGPLLAPAYSCQVRASVVAWLALKDWLAGKEITAAELLPCYVRPSDAELQKKNKG